jgi:hypothetical protein
MNRVIQCVLIALASRVSAADVAPPALPAPTSPTVATVNGVPLTLRNLEDALLKKEGADLVEEWVHGQLEHLDFTSLKDDDIILSIGFNKITRQEIADGLLRRGAGKVRDELIKIRLVEQAVAEAGIVIDQALLDATYARIAKRFEAEWAEKGDTRIDFANYLQMKEKETPEQFRAQPGFRMLAGLQALVHQEAANEANDQELRAWFEAHRERWRVTEAVDLDVIAIPYQPEPGPDGKPVVTQAERDRLMSVMLQLQRQIVLKQVSFAQTWALYAKSWDAEVRDGGHLGYVDRQGRRDGATAKTRILGPDLMKAVWALDKPGTLLPPIASDWGVELAGYRGRRAAREPVFEQVRDEVRAARIDETLEARTESLLKRLKTKANIKYESLPEIIHGKR